MLLVCVGVSHQKSSLSVRESCAVSQDRLADAYLKMHQDPAVLEGMVLSTCNRTEYYFVCAGVQSMAHYLSWFCPEHAHEIVDQTYCYEGVDAVRHLMAVACGLHSMVLGEPQIFGQLKHAFQQAQQAGLVGQGLARVMPAVFSCCKSVRSQSSLGESPVSLASAVVQTAKRIFSDITRAKVLLIGPGQVSRLLIKHFRSLGICNISVCGRHAGRTDAFCQEHRVLSVPYDQLYDAITEADLLVCAIDSASLLIEYAQVKEKIEAQRHRVRLWVDFGVPRNIDRAVGEHPDCYLYNIDDLNVVIQQNLAKRRACHDQVDAMIESAVDRYCQDERLRAAASMICSYREQAKQQTAFYIQKAQSALQKGQDPVHVVALLGQQLCAHLTHGPTKVIRALIASDEAACSAQVLQDFLLTTGREGQQS